MLLKEIKNSIQVPRALEIRRLAPEFEKSLVVFFKALRTGSEVSLFHPHPLNAETASLLSKSTGLDLYYLMMIGDTILAYGMLRGWDEGYQVPSLGLAVHPDFRGRGLGDLLLNFLHAAARQRGAKSIRLKVYTDNAKAVKLYKKYCYKFTLVAEDEWLGEVELVPWPDYTKDTR